MFSRSLFTFVLLISTLLPLLEASRRAHPVRLRSIGRPSTSSNDGYASDHSYDDGGRSYTYQSSEDGTTRTIRFHFDGSSPYAGQEELLHSLLSSAQIHSIESKPQSQAHPSKAQMGDGYVHHSISVPKPITRPHTHPSPTHTPTSGSDQARWLDAHNKVRAQYGAQPLRWSNTLETFAKKVTETCLWEHTQNNDYGENLAAGQTSIEEVLQEWVKGAAERDSYTPQAPEHTHFTQVVWAASTELGCALTSCQEVQGSGLPQSPVPFWVCEYNPPGNVEGEYTENVHAASGGAPAV